MTTVDYGSQQRKFSLERTSGMVWKGVVGEGEGQRQGMVPTNFVFLNFCFQENRSLLKECVSPTLDKALHKNKQLSNPTPSMVNMCGIVGCPLTGSLCHQPLLDFFLPAQFPSGWGIWHLKVCSLELVPLAKGPRVGVRDRGHHGYALTQSTRS